MVTKYSWFCYHETDAGRSILWNELARSAGSGNRIRDPSSMDLLFLKSFMKDRKIKKEEIPRAFCHVEPNSSYAYQVMMHTKQALLGRLTLNTISRIYNCQGHARNSADLRRRGLCLAPVDAIPELMDGKACSSCWPEILVREAGLDRHRLSNFTTMYTPWAPTSAWSAPTIVRAPQARPRIAPCQFEMVWRPE